MVDIGDRVKLNVKAFRAGVCQRTPKNIAKRGTVIRINSEEMVTVQWDDLKQADFFHKSFLSAADTMMQIKTSERKESALLRQGLSEPTTRAVIKVMGALSSLHYRRDKLLALKLVQEHFAAKDALKTTSRGERSRDR